MATVVNAACGICGRLINPKRAAQCPNCNAHHCAECVGQYKQKQHAVCRGCGERARLEVEDVEMVLFDAY